MYNHAPKNYICPICLGVKGIENKDTLITRSDIVYKNEFVTAFISSFFIGNNHGHVIIVPNEHIENIYDLSNELSYKIQDAAKMIALALKETYKCDGISTAQHNEPAGDQHVFHYHFHVFPRYENDNLYGNMLNKRSTTPEERLEYAEKLRKYFSKYD
jgi:histidine triad (HIT) family protein